MNENEKLKVDSSTKAMLMSHGHDIDALYQKYADQGQNCADKSRGLQDIGDRQASDSSNKLDNLFICCVCNGLGIKKVYYNHSVRDENCNNCQGEGIIKRNESGRLRPIESENESFPPDPL